MTPAPDFSVVSFSIDPDFPYQSICLAASFDDERLQSWFKTQAAIEKQMSFRGPDGYIYVFRIDGVNFSDTTNCDLRDTSAYKVGRTSDPLRRQREWKHQCRSQKHEWFEPIHVDDCHNVERMVHIELEKVCRARPRKTCSDCGRVHQEIFLITDAPDAVQKVILPLIRKVQDSLSNNPAL
ncbi:hypothetical protein PQX77_011263 [Marasmius sp. AFHP31]|nr:hypothetical protein PQX77_011263 [Marasmius sp. AFHP31]